MSRFLGPSLILLCTVIWGSAFLAQKLGADHYGPFAITCYRNILGGLFLWLCIRIRDRKVRRREGAPETGRKVLWGGAASGVCLFVAMVSQQLGIEHTTPGISAFLTANYVLLVPVFAWMIGRGRPGASVWTTTTGGLQTGVRADEQGRAWFRSLTPGSRVFESCGVSKAVDLVERGEAIARPGFAGIPEVDLVK